MTITLPAVRILSEDDTMLVTEGLVVPFDGPFPGGPRGTDSYRTYFDDKTEYCLDWYPAGVPVLYDHGFDTDQTVDGVVVRGHALTPIGTGDIASVRMDEAGLWGQTQIAKQARYYDEIEKMLDTANQGKRSKLFHSSESVEHHVKIDARTGHVDQWPLISWSLTPTPSNFYAAVTAAQVRTACRAAGLDLMGETEWVEDDSLLIPATRAVWSTAYKNNLPDSAFAYIEAGGSKDSDGKTMPRTLRHLPYRDANGKVDRAHVVNALQRLAQTDGIPAGDKPGVEKKLKAALAGMKGSRSLPVAASATTTPPVRQGAADAAVIPLTPDDVELAIRSVDEADASPLGFVIRSLYDLYHAMKEVPDHVSPTDPKAAYIIGVATERGWADFLPDAWGGDEAGFPPTFARKYQASQPAATRATSLNTDGVTEDSLVLEKGAMDIRSDIQDQLNSPNAMMMPGSMRYYVQDVFFTAVEPLAGYAIVRCVDWSDYGCMDGDGSYWSYPWELGDDLEPVLSAPTEVTATFVTLDAVRSQRRLEAGSTRAIPLAIDAQWLTRHATAFGQRTKGLIESRATDKRTLSQVNRDGVAEAVTGLRALADEYERLLRRDQEAAEAAARAAQAADPSVRKQRLRLLELADLDFLTDNTQIPAS